MVAKNPDFVDRAFVNPGYHTLLVQESWIVGDDRFRPARIGTAHPHIVFDFVDTSVFACIYFIKITPLDDLKIDQAPGGRLDVRHVSVRQRPRIIKIHFHMKSLTTNDRVVIQYQHFQLDGFRCGLFRGLSLLKTDDRRKHYSTQPQELPNDRQIGFPHQAYPCWSLIHHYALIDVASKLSGGVLEFRVECLVRHSMKYDTN